MLGALMTPPSVAETVSIAPAGDGRDDAARIQAVLEAQAYRGEVHLAAGTYSIQTPIAVPSGTVLIGNPGVRLVSTITPSGGDGSPDNSVLLALPPAPTVETTLAANTTVGASTISVTSAVGFTVGMEIALIADNHLAAYVIEEISGTTITVDRVILHSFVTSGGGTAVVDRVTPKDIWIRGQGMIIEGTGDAAMELSTAWRCIVEGLRVQDCTFDFVLVNFDVGSRECALRDCILDACDVATNCWHFESAEFCRADHVKALRADEWGFFITSGYGNLVDGCWSEGCGTGGAALTSAIAGVGAHGCTLTSCVFVDNDGIGLDVQNVSAQVVISNVISDRNGGTGVSINTGCEDVHLSNVVSRNNGATGLYVVGSRVTAHGVSTAGNAQFGTIVSGEARIAGLTSVNDASGAVEVASGGKLGVSGFDLTASYNGSWSAFTQLSTDRQALRVAGGTVTMSGTGTKIVISSQASGVTYAHDLLAVGGTYGWIASAGSYRRGRQADLSATGTPYTGGQLSFGTVTLLVGGGTVTHPFTDARAGDIVAAVRSVNGGTPGVYRAAISAGVGVVVEGPAGDTSQVVVTVE